MKIVQFSRPPTLLVHLRLKFFHPLNFGRPISNKPTSPNDNKSVKRKDDLSSLSAKFIIIKRWLHFLTSESDERFLVNNILMFGPAWCLVMAQTQFSLIKKLKTRRPELSLPSTLLCSLTSHFCLTPSTPLPHTPIPPQSGRNTYITYNLVNSHNENSENIGYCRTGLILIINF